MKSRLSRSDPNLPFVSSRHLPRAEFADLGFRRTDEDEEYDHENHFPVKTRKTVDVAARAGAGLPGGVGVPAERCGGASDLTHGGSHYRPGRRKPENEATGPRRPPKRAADCRISFMETLDLWRAHTSADHDPQAAIPAAGFRAASDAGSNHAAGAWPTWCGVAAAKAVVRCVAGQRATKSNPSANVQPGTRT